MMEKRSGALINMGKMLIRGGLATAEKAVSIGVPGVAKTYKALGSPASAAGNIAKKINPMGAKAAFGRRALSTPFTAIEEGMHPLTLGFGAFAGLNAASKPNRFERFP